MSGFPSGWTRTDFPFTEHHPVYALDGPEPAAPVLVLCHGMSQTPGDWMQAAPKLLSLPVHCVLPAGPYPHEIRSRDSFRIGHAWYLYDGGPDRFRATVDRSVSWLQDGLGRLESARGWRPRSRILLGYSQGAYFSYVFALRRQDLFTHLVAVAGRLKQEFLAPELARPGALETLIVHGTRDAAVPVRAAEESHAALMRAGYVVETCLLPSGHAFTPEADARASEWIVRRALG